MRSGPFWSLFGAFLSIFVGCPKSPRVDKFPEEKVVARAARISNGFQ